MAYYQTIHVRSIRHLISTKYLSCVVNHDIMIITMIVDTDKIKMGGSISIVKVHTYPLLKYLDLIHIVS